MSETTLPIAKFRIGRIIITSEALDRLTQQDILRGIQRHQSGDWGDVDEYESWANEQALTNGQRLWSVYHSALDVKFLLMTEGDRSVTTVLLQKDY